MTAAKLSQRIANIFGAEHGALTRAAHALPINYDNLRKMLSGNRPIPEWIWGRLTEIERLSSISPPPQTLSPDMDRDGPCAEAVEPHLDNLMERATQAGWLPAEIVTAILGWSVHAAMDGAGPDAARILLDNATEMVTLESGS